MKLCKDCVHSTELKQCVHPKNMKIDYYSGKQEVGRSGYRTCEVLRADLAASDVFWCGVDAIHFEQKPASADKPARWWRFWKR